MYRRGDRRGDRRGRTERRERPAENRRGTLGSFLGGRSLDIPAGHYRPPGECRVWHPERPAGQQAPPEPRHGLRGRALGGAFILYGDEVYDTEHDWERDHARRRTLPEVIRDILRAGRY